MRSVLRWQVVLRIVINKGFELGLRAFSIFIGAILAQLAERLICNQQVVGSIPTDGSKNLFLRWGSSLMGGQQLCKLCCVGFRRRFAMVDRRFPSTPLKKYRHNDHKAKTLAVSKTTRVWLIGTPHYARFARKCGAGSIIAGSLWEVFGARIAPAVAHPSLRYGGLWRAGNSQSQRLPFGGGSLKLCIGVAQSGRALGLGPRGRGFKSLRLYQNKNHLVARLGFFIESESSNQLLLYKFCKELILTNYEKSDNLD